MTQRAKPVTRPRKDRLEAGERRNLLMTIGFGAAIAFAVLMLLVAAGKVWYDDHMTTMLSVNGQSISKDFFRSAVAAEKFRLDQREAAVRALVAANHLSATDGDKQITAINTSRQSVVDDTNTKIIDGIVQTGLLEKRNLTVTDADIDAAVAADSSTPEARKGFMISVTPGISAGETASSQAEIDAAKKRIDDINAELKSGKSWTDVMKLPVTNGTDASTGAASASSGTTNVAADDGSIGWVTKDTTTLDPKVLDAIFSLQANGTTDVIQTDTGAFAIAHITDIAPGAETPDFKKKLADAGVDESVYRKMVGYEVAKTKLSDGVLSEVIDQPSAQRDVSEIKLDTSQGTGDQVRVRHILISPGGDPSKVSAIASTGVEWTQAQQTAQSIYNDITSGKISFQDAAKQKSNDTGSAPNGGLLPWLTRDSVVTEFGDAIFADGLKPDQILAPVKSQYGYHIIQFIGRRPTPRTFIETLRQQAAAPGADFAALAKANSDGSDAGTGGEIGWVARLQLPAERETPIFATPVGGVSDVVSASDGFYIFKVNAEETRKPTGGQVSTIQTSGFDRWYTPLRAEATVDQVVPPANVVVAASPTP
jgi:parvulin-like peptidyl-prolyl isomerase